MIKKRLIILGAAALVVCAIFIPPVRAAAESALAVFRVADTKTIRITVTDIQDMMTALEPLAEAQRDKTPAEGGLLSQILGKAESDAHPISDISEFKGFPLSLPAALKAETPELHAADSQATAITLDTAKINAELSALGATELLDNSLNGTVITVYTPPALMAVYKNVAFAATQNVSIEAPDAVLNALKSSFLSIPAIPEDLHAQLQPIAPKTRDVYLPVIEGLGRETNLDGATGYLYTSGDLFNVLSMLPHFADDAHLAELQQDNRSVLFWAKDGVLYYLAGLTGTMSDSELSQLARSVG